MILYYDTIHDAYVADVPYEKRHYPKDNGFTWTRIIPRKWATKNTDVAYKLYSIADNDAKARLNNAMETKQATRKLSRAHDANISIPAPPHMEYLPYQKAGIQFMLDKEGVLLGDDMGLGKTIQVIGLINMRPDIKSILIICPASLKLNWQRELETWLVRTYNISIADTKTGVPDADIVIVNYDILHKLNLSDFEWDLVALDECHYIKNRNTLRSKAIKGERRNIKGKGWTWVKDPIPARVKVAMTGTPIPNRVREIYNVLNWLDPQQWNNYMTFSKRYCNAHKGQWGWNDDGASNLTELQDLLRTTLMVRRRKTDVLTELPPKRRVIVPLPTNGKHNAVRQELETYQKHVEQIKQLKQEVEKTKGGNEEAYQDAVTRLRNAQQILFTTMSRLRADTAIAKAPQVADHCTDILDGTDHSYKLVVFAHHTAVIDLLMEKLADHNPVHITGSTPTAARQRAVDSFQTDPSVRVFVGNIQAAGVGLTLTASSHVVFAELDWTPANVTQAEDRTHRIGQQNNVLIEHLVFDGSLDARMAKTIVQKQAIADKALDNEYTPPTTDAKNVAPATYPSISQPKKEKEREEEKPLPSETIQAIQKALRTLAGLDTDRAATRNGVGFNRFDSAFGNQLAQLTTLTERQARAAQKMLAKYHAQLDEEDQQWMKKHQNG